MSAGHSPDPLDDPEYLRCESRRLRRIIASLSDPEIRKELAAHSLYLAQRAEAIARVTEDPTIIRMNVERYRSILASDVKGGNRHAVEALLERAEQDLNGQHVLRELASWYRAFAERAGNPAIWEARLRMAEDLEAEADRIERRLRGVDAHEPRYRFDE